MAEPAASTQIHGGQNVFSEMKVEGLDPTTNIPTNDPAVMDEADEIT